MKKYIKPETSVMEIETEGLLAASFNPTEQTYDIVGDGETHGWRAPSPDLWKDDEEE